MFTTNDDVVNKIEAHLPSEKPSSSERASLDKRWSAALLRTAVFLHALRKDPITVIRALYWRVLGLKVRSRNTIGALAGRSTWAYRLWITTRESIRSNDSVSRNACAQSVHILVIASAASTWNEIRSTLDSIIASGFTNPVILFDPRPMPESLNPENDHQFSRVITGDELFKQLEKLDGSWLCAIHAGDRLSPDSQVRYNEVTGISGLSVIYGDDDAIDANGRRTNPYFKPDWNEELFKFQDYISFSCAFKLSIKAFPPVNAGTDIPRQIQSLIGKAITNSCSPPLHISHVLHHRRQQSYLPERSPSPSIANDINSSDSVSIIIPTKNRSDLLRLCLSGVNALSHQNYEVIIVDHDSDEPQTIDYLKSIDDARYKITRWSGPFNYSAINNHGASLARGEFICLLNNDIEMLDSHWLTIMLQQARKSHIGAVGAKLLYPDHTVQHAGVAVGIGGAAGHIHRYLPNNHEGYFNRAHLPQYMTAVTAACLVVQREKFHAVGGLDEENFPVAFNDVDLCLKLGQVGWRNFYEPRAVLIHHESKSRGSDRLKKNRSRFAGELQALKDKWHTDSAVDEFHNVNLSRLSEQFQIDVW